MAKPTMIDDFHQTALAAIQHHLDEAGMPYELDDGELVIDGHRLGLSIAFDKFHTQGNHTLAPLEIQIHLDGDDGERFRVGTLGVGTDKASALNDAISEWHLLAVAPLLAALGAQVDTRRGQTAPQKLAEWDLFPGRVAIRGQVPAGLRPGGPFYRALLERLKQIVAGWEQPPRFTLHSMFMFATCGSGASEVQAAVDGLVSEELTELLAGLPWPSSGDTYTYKQLFVLRHDPGK